MQAHEYAKLLVAELQLAILAEIGHEINMDKVILIAKASANLAIDKIIIELNPQDLGLEMEIAFDRIDYFKEVKQHIEDYGKDQ